MFLRICHGAIIQIQCKKSCKLIGICFETSMHTVMYILYFHAFSMSERRVQLKLLTIWLRVIFRYHRLHCNRGILDMQINISSLSLCTTQTLSSTPFFLRPSPAGLLTQQNYPQQRLICSAYAWARSTQSLRAWVC